MSSTNLKATGRGTEEAPGKGAHWEAGGPP